MIENREETKREIRQFYVVVVQRRETNVQKKYDERAKLLSSCFFAVLAAVVVA